MLPSGTWTAGTTHGSRSRPRRVISERVCKTETVYCRVTSVEPGGIRRPPAVGGRGVVHVRTPTMTFLIVDAFGRADVSGSVVAKEARSKRYHDGMLIDLLREDLVG
jgi:hypothetical protein